MIRPRRIRPPDPFSIDIDIAEENAMSDQDQADAPQAQQAPQQDPSQQAQQAPQQAATTSDPGQATDPSQGQQAAPQGQQAPAQPEPSAAGRPQAETVSQPDAERVVRDVLQARPEVAHALRGESAPPRGAAAAPNFGDILANLPAYVSFFQACLAKAKELGII